MLCDVCREREHVVSLTTTENGAVGYIHLCEKCAAERGVEMTSAEASHPLGAFLQAVQAVQGQSRDAQADAIRCSFCQTSLRDFRASGRLGCAQCYGAFERTLRELLRRVHGNSRHVGRSYQPPHPDIMERASTLGELRDRLRRAIDSEQFELAATLRDQIRGME